MPRMKNEFREYSSLRKLSFAPFVLSFAQFAFSSSFVRFVLLFAQFAVSSLDHQPAINGGIEHGRGARATNHGTATTFAGGRPLKYVALAWL